MGTFQGALDGAVHLCIDMQQLFGETGPWPTPWMDCVLPNVAALTRHAPQRTIFTRFLTPESVGDAGGVWRDYYRKWTVATRREIDENLLNLMPSLQRFVPPAAVFDKTVFSAFSDGRLGAALRERHVKRIIVTGSETDVCVLASVLGAIDLGFHVVVVRDAVCSSADESHDALLSLYAKRFDVQIGIADTNEILERWRPD